MKKLTQAVFDDAPDWVGSAAVDKNGACCLHPFGTEFLIYNPSSGVWGSEWSLEHKLVGMGFDATNWQNSAIDREC